MIDKAIFHKGFIWNLSNCKCDCDKLCDIGEYLYYENCKCRKKLVNKLVEEYTETDDEVRMAKITLVEYEKEWKSSSTLYIVLFSVFLTISSGISTVFVYFDWYSKDEDIDNINPKSNLLNITNEILNK